jgi:hypothetical protein
VLAVVLLATGDIVGAGDTAILLTRQGAAKKVGAGNTAATYFD